MCIRDSSAGVPLECDIAGYAGYDCNELISKINGISPDDDGEFRFARGGNIVILEDPENHRIFIGLNFRPEDICRNINSI